MPDREKVIKGLEGMIDYFFDIYRNDTDSYKCAKAQEYSDCAIDVIKLLKEQEAVYPIKDIARNRRCPKCFSILKGKFCYDCGQAVKWDG